MDFQAPPKPALLLPERPALITPGQAQAELTLDRQLRDSGVPRRERRRILAELRHSGGEQMRAFLTGLGVTALSGGGGGKVASPAYQIARSLRFNSADSAYVSKTPAAGTQDKYKILLRVKRGNLGITATLLSAAATSDDRIYFNTSDQFCWDFAGTNRLISTQVFRDPSAWYDFEFIYDAANGTAAQKARVFVNGVEITAWGTDTRSSITTGTSKFNTAVVHDLGRRNNGTTNYFDGYLCDFALIDNSVTTGFSGQTNSTTGAWTPVAPSLPKWWLKFADNSGTTAATLGFDSGSDAGNWTPNNFSVAAGAGNDSLTDTPTNYGTDTGAGGEVRGNFCTLNPLWGASAGGSALTLANGNLQATGVTSGYRYAGTMALSGGKFIFSLTKTDSTAVGNNIGLGVADATQALSTSTYSGNPTSVGATANEWMVTDRMYIINGSTYTSTGLNSNSLGQNDEIYVAVDLTIGAGSNKIWIGYRASGSSTITWDGNPAAGTGARFSNLPSTVVPVYFGNFSGSVSYLNFGQRPWDGTVTASATGFKALCTQNLPDPTIVKPSSYMDANTRTGTGAAANITGFGFQPDFVWMKGRSGATAHALYDSVRGVQKDLQINTASGAETTEAQGLTAFNSDGFSIGTLAKINTSAATYVDWMWKKGAIPGIDIVGYTGNGSARTIAHSLGVVPEMMMFRNRSRANAEFIVYHKKANATPESGWLDLGGSGAFSTTVGSTIFNSTAPTSSVFSVGTNNDTNGNTELIIAWLFASVPGFSMIGSYTGNGAADGPFVWCGFKPRWVMIKRTDSTSDWYIWDTVRDTYNVMSATLLADTAGAETSAASIDALSNGFKCRSATVVNVSTGTYIFAAFAERPFKYARAR